MDPATLAHQAVVAEEGGNPQLAENFLRAAELATIDDEEVMSLYEALRPHRTTAEQLDALRTSLEASGAVRCAELVRQAAVVYARRGLCVDGAGLPARRRRRRHRCRQQHDGDCPGPGPRRHGRTDYARAGADACPERFPGITSGSGGAVAQVGSRRHGGADELVLSTLRPVDAATVPIPPATSPRSPVRSLRRPHSSTPAGGGSGVGRHVPLGDLAGDVLDCSAIVSVDSATDFEVAAREISRAVSRGWRIAGVIAEQDDAVLIRNRIPIDVPVVDEVDFGGLKPGALVAVEVVAKDAPPRHGGPDCTFGRLAPRA